MKVFHFGHAGRSLREPAGWCRLVALSNHFFLEYVRKRDGGLQTAVVEPVVKRRLLDLEEVEFLGNAG